MRGFNLSAWAVGHRALVGFLIALIFATGALSYTRLGRGEDPTFTVKLMVVSAAWPGASAAETQAQLADPIERKLQDMPYLDHIDTFSRPGAAALLVILRDDTPPAQVPALFYQVRKKLDDLRPSLPQGAQGPFVNDEYTDVYGALFAITGASLPDAGNAELVRQAERIRDRLRKLPGAEKVNVLGEIPRTVFVEFDHARLASMGVTVADISASLARQNAIAPSGLVETSTTRVPIRFDGALTGATALAEVPVTSGGRSLRLGDVATITEGYAEPPAFAIRHNGAPAVVVAISTRKGVNTLTFGNALRTEIAKIHADLPVGLTMQQIANQAEIVGESIGEFVVKFAVALAVVLVVSFVSLGWRAGMVVALAVPLTLAMVFSVMLVVGIDLQRISLGALILSLGLLVDDAIIAIESMMVKLEQGATREVAAAHAWNSTAFPMLTGTLVTAAGFMPVGLAASTTGEYAGGIYWVVGIALLASWVVAVVFTPLLGVWLLPDPKPGAVHHDQYDSAIYRILRRVVAWSVRYRRLVTIGTALLFITSIGAMSQVRQQFFPNSNRHEIIVDLSLRQGGSHTATEAAVRQLEAAIAADPELKRDVAWSTVYLGGGAPRFFLAFNPALPNDALATMVLTTTDLEARERVRSKLLALAAADVVPEARLHVSRLELGPPVGFPVSFRVVGQDIAAVRTAADQVLATLRGTPGVRNAQLTWGERAPSVRLVLDQARVRALGLSPADIAQGLQTLLAGSTATQLRVGTKQVDVVLRAAGTERLDLDRLADLVLPTSAGWIAVGQIGHLVTQTEEPILWRRAREPFLTVAADIQDGMQAPDITALAQPRIAALALPAGIRVDTGGAAEEAGKANGALAAVFPLMIGTMLLIMMIQLQSLGQTLMVLATAPLGIIGAVAGLLLTDAAFGFVALLGVIALAGMIMRNTIILVDQIAQDLRTGLSGEDAIIGSTVRRARPVVLTALAAAFAFVPLSLNVFWGPMAIAMIGGLAVATGLTLVFLPALYAWTSLPGKARTANPTTYSAGTPASSSPSA
ncbi:MAG: efflux RND transporter permease subunit [Acetobacteraceae bacterium]|nr:efflux RND transporter permease subunit [Acetobacteraceae bacterium]